MASLVWIVGRFKVLWGLVYIGIKTALILVSSSLIYALLWVVHWFVLVSS